LLRANGIQSSGLRSRLLGILIERPMAKSRFEATESWKGASVC
jgi:hypothetical protein